MEWPILYILKDLQWNIDPLQCTYRNKQSTDDALLYMLHNIYCHLNRPKRYACVIFYRFSSAFNHLAQHYDGEAVAVRGNANIALG